MNEEVPCLIAEPPCGFSVTLRFQAISLADKGSCRLAEVNLDTFDFQPFDFFEQKKYQKSHRSLIVRRSRRIR